MEHLIGLDVAPTKFVLQSASVLLWGSQKFSEKTKQNKTKTTETPIDQFLNAPRTRQKLFAQF